MKTEVADINKGVISVSSLRHHGTGTWVPPDDNKKTTGYATDLS